ncbi:hypothetical protein Ae201684P_008154 [Aphanomyces euteiches]|nr:hypothetical protein Ae201684P_008154 [Aphanomyces euteiches]
MRWTILHLDAGLSWTQCGSPWSIVRALEERADNRGTPRTRKTFSDLWYTVHSIPDNGSGCVNVLPRSGRSISRLVQASERRVDVDALKSALSAHGGRARPSYFLRGNAIPISTHTENGRTQEAPYPPVHDNA